MFDLFALHVERKDEPVGNSLPCGLCGRHVENPKWAIHIHGGGQYAVTEEEAATMPSNEDLGCYPIGTECAKKIPRKYKFHWREVG